MDNCYEDLEYLCGRCRTVCVQNGYKGGCAFVDIDNTRCDRYERIESKLKIHNFTHADLYELTRIIKLADTYDLVNPVTAEKLLEKIEEMDEEYDQH